jgi:HSP20 family molecular chaperone IbpA
MWVVEQVLTRDKDVDNPWFGHLFVSMGREGLLGARPRVWHPPTDVYETDNDVMVKIEVAGVSEDDFVVRLQGRGLVVAGRRVDPADKLAYQQMEISYGAFVSEAHLPCDVEESDVRARYENGFLYISLPKRQQERKIPVVIVLDHED